MPILDTQRVTDDLVAAGLPQPQARAVTAKLEEAAQAARGNLVTIADLDSTSSALQRDLDRVKTELKSDIADLRSDMNVRFADAEAKHAERMRTHFIALVAAMLTVAGVTLAIARLLG